MKFLKYGFRCYLKFYIAVEKVLQLLTKKIFYKVSITDSDTPAVQMLAIKKHETV